MSQLSLNDGTQHYVDPGSDLEDRIAALERQVVELESSREQVKRDAVLLVLNLLGQSLRHIASGQMDIPDTPSVVQGVPLASAKSEVWNAWKSRLGIPCGKIIDALLTHGKLTSTQISIATGIQSGNVATYIYRINKAGILNKNGKEFSLKSI